MAVKEYTGDIKLSKHFKGHEFYSKNSNGVVTTYKFKMDKNLIKKLEKFYSYGIKSIIITSGYRTPVDSVVVGGFADDAHTRGFAVDAIFYNKNNETIPSRYIACLAQLLGFTGIGIITKDAVHLDIRTEKTYKNGKWFGDETTGATYSDFFEKYKLTKWTLYGYLGYYKEKVGVLQVGSKTPIYNSYIKKAKLVKNYKAGKKARIFAERNGRYKVKSGWIDIDKCKVISR